jgi:putative hydrolases of HD superfamily
MSKGLNPMAAAPSGVQAIIRLAFEAGHLKRSKRTGWWRAGIKDPESVAEHSWRTAVLAYFIASEEGANPERAATIGVFHDLAETRTGDVEYVARRYISTEPDDVIAHDQAEGIAPAIAARYMTLIAEGEAGETPEARCARDADKLECLMQAREYQQQGHSEVQTWIDNMAAAVRTRTGRALAEAALTADPGEWWREVSEHYAATTRALG